MKTKILLLSLLCTGNLMAQTPATKPAHGKTGIDLSLWHNISTQRNDSTGSTMLNLGITSKVHNLYGVGVNVLGSVTTNDVCGVQIGGLFNVTGNRMQGVQIGGLTNVNGDGMYGVSMAGLVSITGDKTRGVLASGLVGITGDKMQGIMLSGLLNVSGENNQGILVAGIANVSGGSMQGIQIGGLTNVTGGPVNGLQLSGLLNVAGGSVSGLQLGGLLNVAGENLNGVQAGAMNVAVHARGLQIGLFNYYQKSMDGLQLGLINASPRTRIQTLTMLGTGNLFQVGARFQNPHSYTIVGIGTYNPDYGSKLSTSFIYRMGLTLPICQRWSLSGDLGYQHTQTMANRHHGYPSSLYALQTRINVEHQFTDRLGAFLTGGYGWDRQYGHCSPIGHDFFFEAGISIDCGRLFKSSTKVD